MVGYIGDAGVNIRDGNARKIVVQRNRIHDPNYRALLWHECDAYRSGHPNGERAIRLDKDGTTTGRATTSSASTS